MTRITITKKIRLGIGQTKKHTWTETEAIRAHLRKPRHVDITHRRALASRDPDTAVTNTRLELARLRRLALSCGSEHGDATFGELNELPASELAKVFKKNAAKRLRRYQGRTRELLAVVLPFTTASDLHSAMGGAQ